MRIVCVGAELCEVSAKTKAATYLPGAEWHVQPTIESVAADEQIRIQLATRAAMAHVCAEKPIVLVMCTTLPMSGVKRRHDDSSTVVYAVVAL